MLAPATAATFAIAALATSGVVVRPWRLPEAVWAVLGAVVLVVSGLLPWSDALAGIHKGLDVYLFLTGMMLLAELARQEGLFDWLAALATEHARGSAQRLFMLVYVVGTIVTVLLSNDATAVVLTPAVAAAARAAGATPLPHLLICAFVANAASFVLPISNPANLVVFGNRMPALSAWLAQFVLPSVLAIGATYVTLWLSQHRTLRGEQIAAAIKKPTLSTAGRLTGAGIICTAAALLGCSALDLPLGLPTFIAGSVTAIVVLAAARRNPLGILAGISWSVLPLVAGLFVLVEGLDRTGAIAELGRTLRLAGNDVALSAWGAGTAAAFASNIMNNLPVGLIAGSVVAADQLPKTTAGALLIGVDLGPNLSITGSLATILWLIALRREGEKVGGWQFLKLGALVMLPALALALAAVVLVG